MNRTRSHYFKSKERNRSIEVNDGSHFMGLVEVIVMLINRKWRIEVDLLRLYRRRNLEVIGK